MFLFCFFLVGAGWMKKQKRIQQKANVRPRSSTRKWKEIERFSLNCCGSFADFCQILATFSLNASPYRVVHRQRPNFSFICFFFFFFCKFLNDPSGNGLMTSALSVYRVFFFFLPSFSFTTNQQERERSRRFKEATPPPHTHTQRYTLTHPHTHTRKSNKKKRTERRETLNGNNARFLR